MAYWAFALCMVGSVAWPLWSDSDLWSFAFAGLGFAVVLPVVLGPALRAILRSFSSFVEGLSIHD